MNQQSSTYTKYPYGMLMDGRYETATSSYRYGFQGQELDDEVKGKGNSVNYKYRMHDPRIGRFFAVDPLAPKYPWYTPYQFSGNEVISMVELEGLEPGFTPDKAGAWEIADYNGTSYMWESVIEESEEGFAWEKRNKMEFQFGDINNTSSKNDDNKSYFPNVYVKPMKLNSFGDDNVKMHRLMDFSLAFGNGIRLESFAAQNEAKCLVANFRYNQGKGLSFNTSSEMSRILSEDPEFINYKNSFESAAMEYFKANNGFPEGFDGDKLLTNLGKPYISDTWFMHTVLGGTQQWNAKITKISATEINVEYTVWDRFGAGTDDAISKLPGLPSLYWLQHNSAQHGVWDKAFSPFIWNIKVN